MTVAIGRATRNRIDAQNKERVGEHIQLRNIAKASPLGNISITGKDLYVFCKKWLFIMDWKMKTERGAMRHAATKPLE